MSARGIAAFIDGAFRGYQFGEGVISREQERELRAAEAERSAERHGWDRELQPERARGVRLGNDRTEQGIGIDAAREEREGDLHPFRLSTAESGARRSAAEASVSEGTVGSRISSAEDEARRSRAEAIVAEGTVAPRIDGADARARAALADAFVAEGTVDSRIERGNADARRGTAEADVAEGTAGPRIRGAVRRDEDEARAAADQARIRSAFDASWADALEAAGEGDTAAVIEGWLASGAPEVVKSYIEAGDIAGAEAFTKFVNSETGRRGIEEWSRMLVAAENGDWEAFGRSLKNAYNLRGYLEDGAEVGAITDIPGPDGKAAGVRVEIKEADGSTREVVFDDPSDLVRLGAGLLSPENAFELMRDRDKAAAESDTRLVEARVSAAFGNNSAEAAAIRADAAMRNRVVQTATTLMKDHNDRLRPGQPEMTFEEALDAAISSMRDRGLLSGAGAAGPESPDFFSYD